MVQFYPKAVSKSYWKRMEAESQDVPRGACLTFGGPAVSLLRVKDLTTVFGIVGADRFRPLQLYRLTLDGVSASPLLVPISTLGADQESAGRLKKRLPRAEPLLQTLMPVT
jgi:hypothetical protein